MTNRKNLKCIITFSAVSGRLDCDCYCYWDWVRRRPFPMWAGSAIRETEINFEKFHVRHLAAWGFFPDVFFFVQLHSKLLTRSLRRSQSRSSKTPVAIPIMHSKAMRQLSSAIGLCPAAHWVVWGWYALLAIHLGSHGECSSPWIVARVALQSATRAASVYLANLIKISLHSDKHTRIFHAHPKSSSSIVPHPQQAHFLLAPLSADAMTIRFY